MKYRSSEISTQKCTECPHDRACFKLQRKDYYPLINQSPLPCKWTAAWRQPSPLKSSGSEKLWVSLHLVGIAHIPEDLLGILSAWKHVGSGLYILFWKPPTYTPIVLLYTVGLKLGMPPSFPKFSPCKMECRPCRRWIKGIPSLVRHP